MTISAPLTAALEASSKATISEQAGTLSASGKFSAAALEAWRAIAAECPANACKLTCRDALGDVVDLASADLAPLAAQDGLRLTLEIDQQGAARVATPGGFAKLLAESDRYEALHHIKLLGSAGFATLAAVVAPWDAAAPALAPRAAAFATPRRFARHLSGTVRAPAAIEPWIFADADPAADPYGAAWRQAAAVAIARTLVSEIYESEGVTHVMLAGSPTRRLAFGTLKFSDELFFLLQQAARWLFAEGQDSELRHTLLINELAREWRDDEDFAVGLPKRLASALDSAGLAYRAHLQQGSRDTIKSLSDLRKTLAEEIGKVTQQTRDLAAGLWRDVAVAIVTIAFRFSMDAAKVPAAGKTFSLIFFLVALYIGTSQYVSVSSNRRFLKVASASREKWKKKGYAYLSTEEYDELAANPLNDALAIYKDVERTANIVVGLVVTALLGIAAVESGVGLAAWKWIAELSCGCIANAR